MRDTEKRYFTPGQFEKISRILGDTQHGLTGSEIQHMLGLCKIQDVNPGITKWQRIYNAFVQKHNQSDSDNFVLKFIAKSLEPSRFLDRQDHFIFLTSQINKVLSFSGLEYKDDGRFHIVKSANSLSEAEMRVSKFQKAIQERQLHPTLLKYCNTELLQNNYFHAVFEAVKGIAAVIRNKTGLTTDGSELIREVFLGQEPMIKINSFTTDTEKSEQRGFGNLLIGIFGTFRNPTAHEAKIEWNLEEQDAFDILSIVSYVMRRLDTVRE